MRRFFLPSLLEQGTISPDDELLHRMNDVLRLGGDSEVEFIDGEGLIVRVKIVTVGKKYEFAEIKREKIKRLSHKISLAVSMIRKERFDLLVEKAVELGADEIIPLHTERSRPFAKDSYNKLCSKWQKIADQALSQCKRVFRCDIHPVMDIASLCSSKGFDAKIVFDPSGRPISNINIDNNKNYLFLIGPEGGFSDDEIKHIKDNGFAVYALTDNILRTETAVFYVLSVFDFLRQGK